MGWFGHARAGFAVLCTLCAPVAPASASAHAVSTAPPGEIPHTQPPASEAERILIAHNAERTRLGLPPLVWSASLARNAGEYARVLADSGQFQHASQSALAGAGENLWMGTAGAWNPAEMIGMFLDERRHFRAATFPHVSLTGVWKDVGHYSQIVWRDTRQVGCAIQSGKGNDVLVCRYFPAGNVVGRSPY